MDETLIKMKHVVRKCLFFYVLVNNFCGDVRYING